MADKYDVFEYKINTSFMRYAGSLNFITKKLKVRFIANFRHCTTTTEVSILLTSCLNAIETSCYEKPEKVYETNFKNHFVVYQTFR